MSLSLSAEQRQSRSWTPQRRAGLRNCHAHTNALPSLLLTAAAASAAAADDDDDDDDDDA